MTTPNVSLLTPLTGSVLPPASPQGLSDDEQRLITGLSNKLTFQSTYVRDRYLYYDGEQRMQSLGISVPTVLANVRQVVDWPRICVDRLVERVALDGFRTASSSIGDELRQHLSASDFDAELPLAVQDSLVTGRGYVIVGSPDVPGDSPIVTVESPLNMTLLWDPRTRRVQAAYQSFEVEGIFKAALYLPDQTIQMSRDDTRSWVIDDRDQHRFGEVPVVRFVNRSRASDREGRSEITPAVISTTDSACRSLLGMEIAREFYAIPHKYILGADESSFVNPDQSVKTPLDMAMDKFLAFARDENDNLPTVGQFTAMDPSVFTKIIDEHAQLMASYTGFPPSYFGQNTTANPSSADAIRVGLDGVDRASGRVTRQSTAPVKAIGQLVWRFAHPDEAVPADFAQWAPAWADTRTKTPAATTDALAKQIAAGMVPPTSNVVLAEADYDAAEREQLAKDRENDPTWQLLNELGSQVAGKDIISALRLLKATGQPVPQPDTTATADVPTPPPPTVPPASR